MVKKTAEIVDDIVTAAQKVTRLELDYPKLLFPQLEVVRKARGEGPVAVMDAGANGSTVIGGSRFLAGEVPVAGGGSGVDPNHQVSVRICFELF